jgi:hypothetical protein
VSVVISIRASFDRPLASDASPCADAFPPSGDFYISQAASVRMEWAEAAASQRVLVMDTPY